jgi:hypothetical protein
LQWGPGDSDQLKYKDLAGLRKRLSTWLTHVFGGSFKDLGSTLSIGKQNDEHSCGICVINAMEHAVLNTALFTHEDRYTLRIRYFVELAEYVLRNVRKPFTISPCDMNYLRIFNQPVQPVQEGATQPIPQQSLPQIMDLPAVTTEEQGSPVVDQKPHFRSSAPRMRRTFRMGQAFQSLGFDGERRIINRHWAQKRR